MCRRCVVLYFVFLEILEIIYFSFTGMDIRVDNFYVPGLGGTPCLKLSL